MEKIILIVLAVLINAIAKSQDDQSLLIKGNELYKKQQFEQAADEYSKAAVVNAKNAKVQYNLGNALYKSKKTEAAEKAFDAAVSNTKDEAAKSKALYNKGVTLSSRNKLLESIEAYKESLRLNSVDEQARQNLQKALNELKKQQQNQQKKDNKNQNKNQDQKQPQQQKNNSKLNQKQIEQMLNALRQNEKKLQQNIQKRNNTGNSNGKDW